MAQHDTTHKQEWVTQSILPANFSNKILGGVPSIPPVLRQSTNSLRTSAGARGEATDQVTFDLLEVRGRRPQV